MDRNNWIELCCEILRKEGIGKPLHVSKIAERLPPNFKDSTDILINKISAALASHVKSKAPTILRGRKKGQKKGFYYLKRQGTKKLSPPELPDVSTNYTGKAGEYGVFSELLFNGFNASIMAVDEGIDIIASKNNKFFHLQVKTANPLNSAEDEIFMVNKVNPNTFKECNKTHTFFIFVLRRVMAGRWISEYIVIPAGRISEMMAKGIIKEKLICRISITKNDYIINNQENINFYVNNFKQIE